MIICMILGSLFMIAFIFLYMTARESLAKQLVFCSAEIYTETIKDTQLEMELLAEQLKRPGRAKDGKLMKQGKALKKKQEEAKGNLENLKGGKMNFLDTVPLAGYKMLELLQWDGTNDVIKKLNQKCMQYKEKKEAINYTYYLLASLFANVLLGIAGMFVGIAIGLATGLENRSLIIGIAVLGIFALMGYLPLDAVTQRVGRRQEEIENQFPQVMSKLALLTIAGMEVSQAWKLAGESGTGTLYEEMRRVMIGLNNNESTSEAYSRFIIRCSNDYTTKLAMAIIQNTYKGNSEIANLFKQLNDESWLEHRHNAKRMGEKIQSKLLIPTMLMFIGIIVLVIVPVMSGFNL